MKSIASINTISVISEVSMKKDNTNQLPPVNRERKIRRGKMMRKTSVNSQASRNSNLSQKLTGDNKMHKKSVSILEDFKSCASQKSLCEVTDNSVKRNPIKMMVPNRLLQPKFRKAKPQSANSSPRSYQKTTKSLQSRFSQIVD